MCCSTPKLPALVLLLGLLAPAYAQELPPAEMGFEPDEPAEQAEPVATEIAPDLGGEVGELPPTIAADELLEIYSQGYSRFEIAAGGEIIAVYMNGVEFRYLTYGFSADELRINQATRAASIKGNVKLRSADLALAASAIEFDAHQGFASVMGPIVGGLADSGLSFGAGGATLSFTPGDSNPILAESTIVLEGAVYVQDRAGRSFTAERLVFDGQTSSFTSTPFRLAGMLDNPLLKPDTPPEVPRQFPVQLTGAAVGGRLLPDGGGISELSIVEPLLVSAPARLQASQARAVPLDKTGAAWRIEFDGDPVRVELNAPLELGDRTIKQTLLQAERAEVSLDAQGVSAGALRGRVVLAAEGNRVEAGSVTFSRVGKGFKAALGDLELGLDLARLLDIEPVDLAELTERGS
jgi:hypothetical protein